MLSLSDVCAIVLSLSILFILIYIISLLREAKANVQIKVKQVQGQYSPLWQAIVISAIEQELKQEYFQSAYSNRSQQPEERIMAKFELYPNAVTFLQHEVLPTTFTNYRTFDDK